MDSLRHIVKVTTPRADSTSNPILLARQGTANCLLFFFHSAREEIAGEKCDVAKRTGMNNKRTP